LPLHTQYSIFRLTRLLPKNSHLTISKEEYLVQKKAWTILAIMLIATLALAGCTKPEAEKPADEQVLTIGTPYTIETFNPFTYSSDGDRYILSQIQESLVDSTGGHHWPLLAESWTNPDNTTWVFKIRDNAYWHEGNEVYPEGANEKVTAQDVVDVFNFVLDPANKARLQAKFEQIVESVEAVDQFTVKFVTKEPYAFFLEDINRVPIFSLKAYETLGPEKFAQFPIGTGPFKFVEYKTDDQVVLERNDAYHIKPNLDKVVFKIIPDKSVAAIALQTGEIDISLQVPPTEVDKVVSSGNAHIVPNSYGWYRYAGFNFKNPLFQDLKVRQAIKMAIDMDEAVTAIFGSETLAERAHGPVPRGIVGWSDDWKNLSEYNPERAKELLAEAGWKPGADGILEKDGKPLKFVLKTPNDVNRSKLGVIMATQLKQIGIDCTPQAQEWATHLEDIRDGATEMFIMGGGSTPDGLLYMFHTEFAKGQSHNTFYDNPELDALLDEARITVSTEEREVLWEQAARMTIEDAVHVNGYNEYVQIGVANKVKGFDENPSAWLSLVSHLRNVSIDSASK
jgi:peptide/nickel transport system substrate-binding protein